MYFEESAVVLVAVEDVDCAFSVILCGENYSPESPRTAVLAKSHIRTEDGTGLTK
jgi:hypothetical protein